MNSTDHACTLDLIKVARRAEVVLAAIFSDGLPPESRSCQPSVLGETHPRREEGWRCEGSRTIRVPLLCPQSVMPLLCVRRSPPGPDESIRESWWIRVSAPCPNPQRTGRRLGVEPLSLPGEAQGQGLVSRRLDNDAERRQAVVAGPSGVAAKLPNLDRCLVPARLA
jgi:hypothetical protein